MQWERSEAASRTWVEDLAVMPEIVREVDRRHPARSINLWANRLLHDEGRCYKRCNTASRTRLRFRRLWIQRHQHVVVRREVQAGGRADFVSRQALDEIIADQSARVRPVLIRQL